MSDPFDSTEKLAAATIVAGLVSGTNPKLQVTELGMWNEIAEYWYDCALALARARQARDLNK